MYLEVENPQRFQDSLRILTKKYEEFNNKKLTLSTELENVKSQEEKSAIQTKLGDLDSEEQIIMSKGMQIQEKLSAIYSEQKDFQKEYMKNNSTLVSYSFLLSDLISYTSNKEIFGTETIDIGLAKNTLDLLTKAYPDHPYKELAHNLISAIENIKIGKKYIDFSAPDLSGKTAQFSEQIEGKIALLDLWATWCGPCIKKSRTMVPIYQEFKDKGFTIVGVAGEFRNTDKLVKFLEKEKWPWLNLVELDRQNNIWQKYGIGSAGGGIFLIDGNGEIIAKDPTAEEVRKEILTRIN
jgi:peroxiredoxin